jgi:hypothetical protein
MTLRMYHIYRNSGNSNSIHVTASTNLRSTLSSTSTSASLRTLRGLYRAWKTPCLEEMLLLEKQKNHSIPKDDLRTTEQKDATSTTVSRFVHSNDPTTTTIRSNQRRSNAITQFLINQYRVSSKNHQQQLQQQQIKNLDQQYHHQSEESLQTLQNIASLTLRLRQDIAQRTLLQSLDTGVEEILSPKEMSRRAAARAGLHIPDYNAIMDSTVHDNNNDNNNTKKGQ